MQRSFSPAIVAHLALSPGPTVDHCVHARLGVLLDPL